MSVKITFAMLVLLLNVAASFAQETTGSLRGRVVGEAGNPVPFADVVVTSPNLQGIRAATSTSDGRFLILELPVGIYSLTISHASHHDLTYEDVLVQLGRMTSLADIELTPRIHQMPDMIVYATPPLIDPTSTYIGANIGAEDYRALPIERNYRSVTVLLPHVNESFLGDGIGAAGGTGLENKYFIDGVDVTEPIDGGPGTNLPYNFIREIQVKTGAYEAEYRSSLGGVVNVVTHSGGDEIHGQAFGFFINNQFTSGARESAFEPGAGDFAHYDAGFGIGGPILRERLWFFTAYNPTVVKEDAAIPGGGYFEDRSTTHSFAGKLTWRANDRNDLVFTILGDPAERRSVGDNPTYWGIPDSLANPDPHLGQIESGGITASLLGRHRVSDRVLLKTSLSRASPKFKYLPDTERGRAEMMFFDVQASVWSGGAPEQVDSRSVVTTAGVTATILADRHTFKTGLEYKDNRYDFDNDAHILLRFAETAYAEGRWTSKGTVQNRIPSAFIQDAWSISHRLRINAGLRWDGQFIVGSDGRVAQKILDQWQPRVGFIFLPEESGAQKVLGSFGRFYQELSTGPISSYFITGGVGGLTAYDHDPREDPSGGYLDGGPNSIQPELADLEGQHYDEFTLGYERRLAQNMKLGLRGIYRTLRQGIEDGQDPETGEWQLNNPGKGLLSAYPRLTRDYTALEVVFEYSPGGNGALFASYVLSRSHGNYPGLYNTDIEQAIPNTSRTFDWIDMVPNSTGLLPNDRPHVLKLAGSRRIGRALTAGISFTWQSGTPYNEFGAMESSSLPFAFLRKRGTAGRSPAIWDLNLRFQYAPRLRPGNRFAPRLTLDLLHVASQKRPVLIYEVHYLSLDEEGNQTNPDPNWERTSRHQPPMAARLGVEVDF